MPTSQESTRPLSSKNRLEIGRIPLILFVLTALCTLGDYILLKNALESFLEIADNEMYLLGILSLTLIVASQVAIAHITHIESTVEKAIVLISWLGIGLTLFAVRSLSNTLAEQTNSGPALDELIHAALVLCLYLITGIGLAVLGRTVLDPERSNYYRAKRRYRKLLGKDVANYQRDLREQMLIRDWYIEALDNLDDEKARLRHLIETVEDELKAHARDRIARELASPKATSEILAHGKDTLKEK